MKRKFYVINEVKGKVFMEKDEELCKLYCEIFGYTYRVEYMNLGF